MIPDDNSKPWEWKLRPDYSIDPHRFDHLADEWFWIDDIPIPVNRCWTVEHAIEVAQSRLDSPCGLEVLAKRFGRNRQTIMAALQHAKSQGVDATQIDARRLQPNWAIDHATEVAKYFRRTGSTMSAAVEYFGKSDAWIRAARRNAETQLREESTSFPAPRPDDSRPLGERFVDDAAL